MKSFTLLLAFCALMTPVAAQRKYELGIVLKAGNFGFPDETRELITATNPFYEKIIRQQVGRTVIFGVAQSLRLGGHFRVSAEILYRYALITSTKLDHRVYTPNTGLVNVFDIKLGQIVAESSFALPIKVHYTFRKDGRSSIAGGLGVSHKWAAHMVNYQTERSSLFPENNINYTYLMHRFSSRDFATKLSITAGFYHRIKKNTTLGLEFTYEDRSLKEEFYDPESSVDLSTCYCNPYPYIALPAMRSFTFSLYHNLLRKKH